MLKEGGHGDVVELPSVHRARVAALPIGALTQKLVKKARKWGVGAQAAEDLANEAFLVLIRDGAASWDHVKDPKGWVFLLRAMEDHWSMEKKRKKRRRTDSDTEAVEDAPPSSDRGALGAVIERDTAMWAQERLLAGLAGSPLALKIVRLCMEDGKLASGEIAERLGEPVERVDEAQRRIKAEAELVVEAAKRREGPKR